MTFIEFAEKVLGIELLDWQKAVLEAAQKCKDEGKSFNFYTSSRSGKTLLNNIYQQKLGYDRGFEDGRVNANDECISTINNIMPIIVLETYKQGKADQKKEDNEFFNFDKVIEIEKNKSYKQGAREFAEWLQYGQHNFCIVDYDNRLETIPFECVIAEWQKGEENE